MDEKYDEIMPDLQDIRENLNCYTISSLLNDVEETHENEATDSNASNMASSSSAVENGAEPMAYSPTYKLSKFKSLIARLFKIICIGNRIHQI